MQVELWASKTFGDKLLGVATLNVESCMRRANRRFEATLQLRPTDGSDLGQDSFVSPGEIEVRERIQRFDCL